MFGSANTQAMFAAAAAAINASPTKLRTTSLSSNSATSLATASTAAFIGSTPQIIRIVNSPDEGSYFSQNNQHSGDFLVYLVSLPDSRVSTNLGTIPATEEFFPPTFSLENCCSNFNGFWANHSDSTFSSFQAWANDGNEFKPLIDISTPETLERDFYAWLKGELRSSSARMSKLNQSSLIPGRPFHDHPSLSSVTFPAPNSIKMEAVPVSVIEWTGSAFREIKEELLLSAGESPPIFGSPSLSCCSSNSPQSSTTCAMEKCMNSGELISNERKPDQAELGVRHEQVRLPSTCPIAIKINMPIHSPDLRSRLQRSTDQSGTRSSGMNQLGRTYSPGLPLSMDERKQIVEMHESGWKICDISKKLCVTHSCVSKILNRFRTTGSVRPKDAKEGRQESPLVIAIRDYRQRLGMVRQSEIREQLIRDGMCKRENAPSRSSINHILRTKLNVRSNRPKRKMSTKNE